MKEYWKPSNLLNPLPVVLVTCESKGVSNVLTVAWCGTVCSEPPMVSVSIRKERWSYHLIDESKQFVVNLTNEAMAYATDFCGVTRGEGIDKFKKAGLTPIPSKYVTAPTIEESPCALECEVVEQLDLGSHVMFVGKILGTTIDTKHMDEKGKFCLNESGLITYSHGQYYVIGKHLGKFGYSIQKKQK